MYYLVTCIRNFASNAPKRGFQVISESEVNSESSFLISKQHPDVKKIISSNNYLAYIGTASFQKLASEFFAISSFESEKLSHDNKYLKLSNFMQYVECFCAALWFVKDNGVTPNFATLSSDVVNNHPSMIRRSKVYTVSTGKNSRTTFSKRELEESANWYKKLCKFSVKISREEFGNPIGGFHNLEQFIDFDVPSFNRAYYFLNSARSSDFVPAKISNYISVLECLFAVNGENTHKVAERAAVFVANKDLDRLKVFKDVKDAYKIRSSYVHGSEIGGKKKITLTECSSNIDSVVRRVFKEMLVNHEGLNYRNKKGDNKSFEEVNDWFDELILIKG